MTERLTAIAVRAFRGVPDELRIELRDGRGLVVLGDNGTGKSTVADALEFFFTAQIGFLAREGRAIIQHQAAEPDAAVVEVETTGTVGGRATLSESVAAARSLGARENFLLSGRTLAEFVDKNKGEKWKYLFEILGLAAVDQLRLDLQQARNALEGDRTRAQLSWESAVAALRPRCAEVTDAGLFTAVQVSCRRAGVDAPTSLDVALQNDWATALTGRTNAVRRAAQFQQVTDDIGASPAMPKMALARAWNAAVGKIKGAAITRVRLLEAADAHLRQAGDLPACPVCGQAIEHATLRQRIAEALSELRASSQELEAARRILRRFISEFGAAVEYRQGIVQRAARLGVELPSLPPDLATTLGHAVDRAIVLDLDAVEAAVGRLRDWDGTAAKPVRKAAPQTGTRDEEFVNLVLLIEEGKRWRHAQLALRQAQRAVDLAERIHDAYARRLNAYVSAVLARISDRVASIYARLHPEESLRGIAVETWGEKGIELAGEFHGVRQRPPHGVLSESHLNSLGIALFLAMAETFNERLGFLVLDDVVNSFDVDHRGRLAEFLASEYQDRQVIVLTHDRLFY